MKDLQRTTGSGDGKDSREIIKLLTNINAGIGKGTSQSKTTESKTPTPAPATASSQGGSAGYKAKSEVFPSDVLLMTNMYTMTQFNGGY